MDKICTQCNLSFQLTQDDLSFYKKIKVPEPTLCPRCRRIRRFSWLNDYVLYNRQCFICNKDFISLYAENNIEKVLCPKCFHGDNWDPEQYALEYDPNLSFFEQFYTLLKSIPLLGIINDDGIASIGCLYNNDIAFSKNCILCFVSWKMENCFYSFYVNAGKDLVDCHGVFDLCEFTYESVMIEQINRSRYMYWSLSSSDCAFGYDLRGCVDCFMCFGLRNKQYYFKNQKYSREEYIKILKSYNLHTRTGVQKAKQEFEYFLANKPRKFAEARNAVDCSGSDIPQSKNTKDSKFAPFSVESRFCQNGVVYTTCYDCTGGGDPEIAYECITPDQSYNSIGTNKSWKNRNVSYCIDTHSSEECFGCIGIKKGTYMILNKRYEKEEYFKLKEKIIANMTKDGEYGEFFPTKMSPFGINETRALDELKISKEDALRLGYKWQDKLQETRGKETLTQKEIPDSITDVPDTIVDQILACVSCERNYKILPDELFFYRRMNIPIPDSCFFCRMKKREAMRGGFDLIERKCDCKDSNHFHQGQCKVSFQTFFNPKDEIRPIYCEKCYQNVLF